MNHILPINCGCYHITRIVLYQTLYVSALLHSATELAVVRPGCQGQAKSGLGGPGQYRDIRINQFCWGRPETPT